MKSSDDTTLDVILFNSHSHLLAIEVKYVEEILQEVDVSPLPFVPAYVEGLVNINGIIMPQVNLATLLFEEQELPSLTSKTILIVNIEGVSISVKIDHVKESISINKSLLPQHSETIKKNNDVNEWDKISSQLLEINSEKIIFFDAYCLKDIVKSTAKPIGKQGFLGQIKEQRVHTELYRDFLIATVNSQEYAIDLEEVGEIVILEDIQSLPRTPPLIAGMSLIRSTPRLMLYFAELLGEKYPITQSKGTAIMLNIDDMYLGIVADAMVGLESIRQSNIRQNSDKTHLTIMREDNKTLTRVIRFTDFFTPAMKTHIRAYLPLNKNFREQRKVHEVEMLKFYFGQDAYAFHLDKIRRIVSHKPIEPLLSEHAYLMGTMELEGHVIPVINLVKQLGYSNVNIVEYIVISDGIRDWAVAIGETDQIIKVPELEIDKIKNEHSSIVSAYCNIDDSLLTILNIQAICKENAHSLSVA